MPFSKLTAEKNLPPLQVTLIASKKFSPIVPLKLTTVSFFGQINSVLFGALVPNGPKGNLVITGGGATGRSLHTKPMALNVSIFVQTPGDAYNMHARRTVVFIPLSGIIIGPSSPEAKALIQGLSPTAGPDLIESAVFVGDVSTGEARWTSDLWDDRGA